MTQPTRSATASAAKAISAARMPNIAILNREGGRGREGPRGSRFKVILKRLFIYDLRGKAPTTYRFMGIGALSIRTFGKTLRLNA
jgi:hypothetical protein